MKWYFASNDKSPSFFPLIKAAVESAIKNTSLKPHFLYDGEENELTHWLKEKGVVIIPHRVSFYDQLKEHYDESALVIASGTFLRCDIPIIEQEDDFILYTDCDVLFLKEFECNVTPKYFACAPQFKKNDYKDFNAGVMLMNVKKMRESHTEFSHFIFQNLKIFNAFDQTAYQIFYNKKCTKLPQIFNHKPYWGMDKNAIILHFHGPKPINFISDDSIKYFPPIYYSLYRKNPQAYEKYLAEFLNYNSEIAYDNEAIEKLKKDIYPINKKGNSFLKRLKIRLDKELKIISQKF